MSLTSGWVGCVPQLFVLTVYPIAIFSSCCQRVSLVFFEIYAARQNIKKFYTFQ